MPEFQRVSALAGLAKPGRFGADNGAPGVTLSVRHPLSIVTVIARKGKSKLLSEALAKQRGIGVRWAGPDQYFAISEGALYGDLKKKLGGLASLSDQSHGRIVIRIEGPKARAVLAKGTPIDLHAGEFPVGKSALTQMAHVGVHVTRVGEDAFELSLFRGFAESFWEWLTLMSEEFGYRVT
ncbi:MAG: sarcosine oxidase subunit gamma [Rhizobiales bacterium]|nr:sarcosine oxidase subunit gamma [Hyphomicrobiales bacterium]